MPCSLSFAKPAPETSGAGVLSPVRRAASTVQLASSPVIL